MEYSDLVPIKAGDQIIVEQNKVLMMSVKNQQMVYVDMDVAKSFLDLELPRENSLSMELPKDINSNTSCTTSTEPSTNSYKINWSREEILCLINLYKEHIPLLNSSTIRNETVWQKIVEKLEVHSAEQYKNKFKYLNSRYVEKVDNTKSTSTGAKAIKFEYFEELDKIFAKSPNIKPAVIACSSKENVDYPNIQSPSSKKRKSDRELTHAKHMREIEEARTQRHKEKMENNKEALGILKQLADSIAELSKK